MGPNATTIATLKAIACLLCGLSPSLFAWQVAEIILADRGDAARRSGYETTRRRGLRRAGMTYRLFEPLVDALAGILAGRKDVRLAEVETCLATIAEPPAWSAAEWLAARQLEATVTATVLGAALGAACWTSLGASLSLVLPPALVYPALLVLPPALVYPAMVRVSMARLRKRARRVRSEVRAQLPFAIDLMTLMIEAGSSFPETLATLAEQTRGTSLARHVEAVLREVRDGTHRLQALANWSARLAMEEVAELVVAIRQGELLGRELAHTLSVQAGQIRLRHSTAIEKAAERCKVDFAWPTTLCMIACIIAILGPLLLNTAIELRKIF